MKKMNKLLRGALLVLGATGIMVLLGFVGSLRSTSICEALDVQFGDHYVGLFSEAEVRERAIVEGKMPVGMALGAIDTRSIEQAIMRMPHVKNAVVYKTIDRKLVVELEERQVILRLIDKQGRSALLDAEGHLLPLSQHVALRVPVLTGHFALSDEALKERLNVNTDDADPALYSCYQFALQLQESPFWLAQLQHTELTGQGEFIAHPQVGNHSIYFGDASRLEEKFEALDIFYREGMDASRWNKYSTINLKFKDQIVCTKK